DAYWHGVRFFSKILFLLCSEAARILLFIQDHTVPAACSSKRRHRRLLLVCLAGTQGKDGRVAMYPRRASSRHDHIGDCPIRWMNNVYVSTLIAASTAAPARPSMKLRRLSNVGSRPHPASEPNLHVLALFLPNILLFKWIFLRNPPGRPPNSRCYQQLSGRTRVRSLHSGVGAAVPLTAAHAYSKGVTSCRGASLTDPSNRPPSAPQFVRGRDPPLPGGADFDEP